MPLSEDQWCEAESPAGWHCTKPKHDGPDHVATNGETMEASGTLYSVWNDHCEISGSFNLPLWGWSQP